MSGLDSDEQRELFFLRVEKAAAHGAKEAIKEHMESTHRPLVERLNDMEERHSKTSNRTLVASGIVTGGMGILEFLRYLKVL